MTEAFVGWLTIFRYVFSDPSHDPISSVIEALTIIAGVVKYSETGDGVVNRFLN